MSFIAKIKPLGFFLKQYHAFNDHLLRRQLGELGLRISDTYRLDNDLGDLMLSRLPKDVYEARFKRIMRAADITLKGTYIPEEQWDPDTFKDDFENDDILSQSIADLEAESARADVRLHGVI